MNRFFWKLLAVVAALFGTCGIHTPVHAQNSNKIDLAEVTQRLTQWRSSMINLHIVYEMRNLATTTDKPLTEWPIPEDPESGRQFLRKEWIWADHGLDLFATFSPGQKVATLSSSKSLMARRKFRFGPLTSRQKMRKFWLS